MKCSLAVTLLSAATFCVGCSKSDQSNQSSTDTNAAPGVMSSAVNLATNQNQKAGEMLEQYGHTLAKAKNKALSQTDLISVDRAVQSYQAAQGKIPDSLDDLIKEGFLSKLPDLPKGKKYVYNPKTGEVTMADAN